MSESDIQRQIMDWLTAQGIFHWRVPLGGVTRGSSGFRARNPMTGHPDIACLFYGHYVAIEVKTPGKQKNLSVDQKRWQSALTDNGAVCIVATSLGEVQSGFEKLSYPVASGF